MNFKVNVIPFIIVFMSLYGCSSYSDEDYGEAGVGEKESLCVNMEPAQEEQCKERERKLVVSLGADKNCNHPYEYEKNRCKHEQENQKKLLDESLKKHLRK